MSTFMASWPGGSTAWDTEDDAQAEADRRVREGAPHVVGWELASEVAEDVKTPQIEARGRVGRFWRGRGSK